MDETATGPPPADAAGPPTRQTQVAARREGAVDAFIDLVLEGHLPPTPEEVAHRAGISMATLYRYFATLDELRQQAAVRMLDRFAILYRVDRIGEGTRRQRVERFTAGRVELYEATHLLSRLLRSTAVEDRAAAELVDFARAALADQARLHFDEELARLRARDRDDAVVTIAALTSVESWEQYRLTFGRTPAQTRRAWASTVDRILDLVS